MQLPKQETLDLIGHYVAQSGVAQNNIGRAIREPAKYSLLDALNILQSQLDEANKWVKQGLEEM